MDQGIAGMVATSGQILNIPDAYDNPHFNQTIDKKTGECVSMYASSLLQF